MLKKDKGRFFKPAKVSTFARVLKNDQKATKTGRKSRESHPKCGLGGSEGVNLTKRAQKGPDPGRSIKKQLGIWGSGGAQRCPQSAPGAPKTPLPGMRRCESNYPGRRSDRFVYFRLDFHPNSGDPPGPPRDRFGAILGSLFAPKIDKKSIKFCIKF